MHVHDMSTALTRSPTACLDQGPSSESAPLRDISITVLGRRHHLGQDVSKRAVSTVRITAQERPRIVQELEWKRAQKHVRKSREINGMCHVVPFLTKRTPDGNRLN